MPVTIQEVARQAGLSKQTVSNILGSRGHLYNAETRQQVLGVARALGYRPNSSARAISTGRFGNIALLVSTYAARSHLFTGLLDGIQDALDVHNLHLTLARLPDEKLTSEGFVPKILRERASDGLLINYNSSIPPRMIALIQQYQLPSIWINMRQGADCVYPNDVEAARRATEHLLRLGHRRITYLVHRTDHYSGQDRRDGYEQAMRAAGLVPRSIEKALGVAGWAAHLTQVLSSPELPTAVVAYTPFTALPALFAARSCGLQVPRDLSLVTFEETPLHDSGSGVPITTCLLPSHALGEAAVEMLLEKIADPSRPQAPRALDAGFAPGATCAPPSPNW